MNDQQKAELSHQRDLVKLERDEERRLHLEVIQAMPLIQRVAKGYSWYPLQVSEASYGIGGRPVVAVTREGEEAHQFRAGTSVNLFTTQPHANAPQRSGVIKFVKKGRMEIVLGGEDLPDWLGAGGVGVDLMFDERTYVEMDRALQILEQVEGGRIAELRDVIMGARPASYRPVAESAVAHLAHLNQSQRAAVAHLLGAEHVALIHGPPGTGKTTTLVAAVGELVKTEGRVLFCTPSNSAADLVTIRLAASGLHVVRTGNISRVEDEVMRHTLDLQIASHPDTLQVKKLRQEAADLRKKAHKAGGKDKGLLFRDAGRLNNWARQLEDRTLDHLLDTAEVIVCTLVGAATSLLNNHEFKTVIIDEAAQALEPATWIPILKANRVVLAGDPFQLPPTVKSRDAERGGLNITLLEKCLPPVPQSATPTSGKGKAAQDKVRFHPRAFEHALLEVQYRMNERIMGFSNEYFYGGRLRAAELVAQRTLPGIPHAESVVFIDTAGTGFEEKLHPRFQSRYNDGELDVLIEHLLELHGSIPPEDLLPTVAIITPYREQAVQAEDRLENESRLAGMRITINTVDGFQGRERDVVYLSLVRSNERQEIGFLADYRRMNVALTRAKKYLIVVGDSATIGHDAFFAGFLEYVEKYGRYQTAWEFMR
ncbi:AAA domain-containing protein [Neolewinella lacunae]|uniref:AAA family ATPase n=1 Tax=Neolewinella lacunae TaxID=1517758 RepID=A0A923PIU4_9BACT|nr:AAA domain-containing protein [Neolewinella lacunae]MBC6994875.1 AAA family ATPase [Neolewinella lacunae]MDN3636795.1 AAA domain-containing protein [Neolewinella lacunae]